MFVGNLGITFKYVYIVLPLNYGRFIANSNTNWYPGTAPNDLWRTSTFYSNDPCAHYKPVDGSYVPFWNGDGSSATTTDAGSPACADPGHGWRLPSTAEFAELYRGDIAFNGALTTAQANTIVNIVGRTGFTSGKANYNKASGLAIRPDDVTTTLFLPSTGSRNYSSTAVLVYTGTYGYYWTHSISSTGAHYFYFHTYLFNPSIISTSLSSGFALRCIKNQ